MPKKKRFALLEKKVTRNHEPISIEKTKLIIKQLKKSTCKIFLKNNNHATGFFCEINYNNENLPVLITNNHVINEEMLKSKETIFLTLNDEKVEKEIKFRYPRKVYTNTTYDTTIIEIIPKKDDIDTNNFLKLDKKINQKSHLFSGKSIYILQYPDGKYASVSYGIIEKINESEYDFTHLCSTSKGSSGSPILNLETNDVIGIHNKAYKNFDNQENDFNGGIFLKESIKEFQNGINSFTIGDNVNCFVNLIKEHNIEISVYNEPLKPLVRGVTLKKEKEKEKPKAKESFWDLFRNLKNHAENEEKPESKKEYKDDEPKLKKSKSKKVSSDSSSSSKSHSLGDLAISDSFSLTVDYEKTDNNKKYNNMNKMKKKVNNKKEIFLPNIEEFKNKDKIKKHY